MKYRLPGIYLGNIPLDLFMEYMTTEDLSNQTTTNDYYRTNDRVENIKVFRVYFNYPLDGPEYNFYTYDILDKASVRNTIRVYFKDIISSDPSYDLNVDDIIFDWDVYIENPVLFDTINKPSIYGTYMISNSGD
jgi:hypothetical protein